MQPCDFLAQFAVSSNTLSQIHEAMNQMRAYDATEENGMGRLIGYARVSTADQDLSLQLDALRDVGCHDEQLFLDRASGARTARPGLEACIETLVPGDTLVVWRLDRLGRSMAHLVTLIEQLLQRQVMFRSLCDGAIDTTTASGELVFHIFSALAQFERRLVQERTRAGLAAARARGRRGGRKPLQADHPRVRMAYMMSADQHLTVTDICRTLRISPATFYRYVALGRRAADQTSHHPRERINRKDGRDV
jgi:DNA invertase Pin-like site-specific DNA recombinase